MDDDDEPEYDEGDYDPDDELVAPPPPAARPPPPPPPGPVIDPLLRLQTAVAKVTRHASLRVPKIEQDTDVRTLHDTLFRQLCKFRGNLDFAADEARNLIQNYLQRTQGPAHRRRQGLGVQIGYRLVKSTAFDTPWNQDATEDDCRAYVATAKAAKARYEAALAAAYEEIRCLYDASQSAKVTVNPHVPTTLTAASAAHKSAVPEQGDAGCVISTSAILFQQNARVESGDAAPSRVAAVAKRVSQAKAALATVNPHVPTTLTAASAAHKSAVPEQGDAGCVISTSAILFQQNARVESGDAAPSRVAAVAKRVSQAKAALATVNPHVPTTLTAASAAHKSAVPEQGDAGCVISTSAILFQQNARVESGDAVLEPKAAKPTRGDKKRRARERTSTLPENASSVNDECVKGTTVKFCLLDIFSPSLFSSSQQIVFSSSPFPALCLVLFLISEKKKPSLGISEGGAAAGR